MIDGRQHLIFFIHFFWFKDLKHYYLKQHYSPIFYLQDYGKSRPERWRCFFQVVICKFLNAKNNHIGGREIKIDWHS